VLINVWSRAYYSKTKKRKPYSTNHASGKISPMPGRFVPIGGGKAFIPDPLPPKLDFDSGLARRPAEASEALGRLDGLGRALPIPICSFALSSA